MPNEVNSSQKSKKLFLALGLVLIVVVLLVVWASSSKKSIDSTPQANEEQTTGEQAGEVVPQEPTAVSVTSSSPEILKTATVVVPGANPISAAGKVLTPEGKPVKNDSLPMAPDAPRQTQPVDVKVLAKEVIKINASSSGFSPSSFTVKKGAPITLSLTSTDGYTHVMVFSDASLSSVAMGVAPGETRVISFNAPEKAGEYAFRCTVPGHEARGEKGVMIVQ
jgi:uncharacterized cupredoxin-like copper-binding protein